MKKIKSIKDNLKKALLPLAQPLAYTLLAFIAWLLVKLLPMLDGITSPWEFSIQSLVHAPLLLILAALLINLALRAEEHLLCSNPRFPQWGQLVKFSGFVVGIYTIYQALKPLLLPYLFNYSWIFNLVFFAGFAASLAALVFVAVHVIRRILPLYFEEAAPKRAKTLCMDCGRTLKPWAKYCPGCGALVQEESFALKFNLSHQGCNTCGRELKPDMNYCPKCGRAVPHDEPVSEEDSPLYPRG